MKQFHLILLTFLIATLFVVQCHGNEPEKITEYQLDSNGKTIGSKVIIKEDESEALSDVESTFVPDAFDDDNDDIPAEMEDGQGINEKVEIVVDNIDGDDDDDDDKEEVVVEEEEEEEEEDEFGGNFITVHMGNFIHHPFENEEYKIIGEENENENEQEPVVTERIEIPEKEEEEQEKEKEEEEHEEEKEQEKEEEQEQKEQEQEPEQDIETQDKVKMMEEVETEGNEGNDEEEQEEGNNDDDDKPNEVEEVETEGNEDNNEGEQEEGEDNKPNEEVIEVEVVMDNNVIIANYLEMKNFFKDNDRIVIGCFESLENEYYINFRNASNALIGNFDNDSYFNGGDLKFVTVNDKQCRNVVKRFTGFSIYKNDVVYCVYDRCYEYDPQYLEDFFRLKNFINEKELPLISEYEPSKKDEYKKWNTLFLVYLNNDEEKTREDINSFLAKIAESFLGEFVVFVSNDENFNIDTLDEPRDHNVLLFAPEFQTMYSIQEILDPEDAIDKVAVDSFLMQYDKGYLTPKMIVQDFESMWDYEGFVVKSVPRLYFPHALNPNRDSLVVYYKTDCPFSQELLKTIDKLGKKYANYRTKFSIVKYEAEEQKIPKMSLWRKLEGYPTIVLYKASPYTREKKQFFVYPDNGGRSSVTLGNWIQAFSFYKPKAVFTEEDYKEKEVLEVDSDDFNETEEEEEKINRYLDDPQLIFTRFGYGKEMEQSNEDEGDEEEDDDDDKENVEYYFDNVTTDSEIPITGTYYELSSTTYLVKTSYYTPPPSIYDDDDEEEEKKKEGEEEE